MSALHSVTHRMRAAVGRLRVPRIRFGLAVGHDHVRAVAIRGERILWAAESPLADASPLEASLREALRELLDTAPTLRRRGAALVVAVGPGWSQVKRLHGLPRVRDARDLERLVRAGAARFFVRTGGPLLTTGVRVTERAVIVGAIEAGVVDAITSAFSAAGLRLGAVVPAVAVLERALEGERATWRDGPVTVDLTFADRRLDDVRRVTSPQSNRACVASTVAALGCLGPDGWRFADAYGAALTGDDPLALRPSRRTGNGPVVPRWRLALAASALSLSLAALPLAPGMAATLAARRAERRLAAIDPRHLAAAATTVDLERVTDALEEVARFDAGRRSVTLAVADLARALPTDAFLVTVRFDSTGGTLVALASRGAEVPARIERSGFAAPEIVGPVTREVVNAVERERVTVRFRWTGSEDGRAVETRR